MIGAAHSDRAIRACLMHCAWQRSQKAMSKILLYLRVCSKTHVDSSYRAVGGSTE